MANNINVKNFIFIKTMLQIIYLCFLKLLCQTLTFVSKIDTYIIY